MAEDGRIQTVWVMILLFTSCCFFTFVAILFGIIASAITDPNEMSNAMSCTVLKPQVNCKTCEGTHTCCEAIVKVAPGTLFANVTNFQPIRTTEEFSSESTYYSYAANSTVTCYVGIDPESEEAHYAKYDGPKVELKTVAIVTGCIAICYTAGLILAPFFSKSLQQTH
ncbi:predicted protein [Naegleria gruberi]|uniref:Predicted protein n=1 Tax=Naegleria gruberi TaxID=5762 RepID=D2VPE1_NAEGR|nr:uncharacterized protein NAEGRDRAFT_80745 [Naegleria gruberi]EFC41343.1 predicted protein [Naegleria gruberi]|eukprot:XP_002674087.1 predicted protein [Naegleria gruberi strain NEG-M]